MEKILIVNMFTMNSFIASENAETYYYAKRGCAADPEDGISTGDQRYEIKC